MITHENEKLEGGLIEKMKVLDSKIVQIRRDANLDIFKAQLLKKAD